MNQLQLLLLVWIDTLRQSSIVRRVHFRARVTPPTRMGEGTATFRLCCTAGIAGKDGAEGAMNDAISAAADIPPPPSSS
eukprot:2365750-Prymnesium_polylepis.1